MGVSFKPERLRRYRDLARLLWKYGRSDLVKTVGLDEALVGEVLPTDGAAAEAEQLADDLETMGPTFVKLGQLLSTRADVLPAPYVEALTRLQDRVAPVPVKQVVDVVESELAMPLLVAFREFDETPLAAASLGQVHRALLPDGAVVAVKVQRPGVREEIAEDLAALRDVAEFLDAHTDWGRRPPRESPARGVPAQPSSTSSTTASRRRNLTTLARNPRVVRTGSSCRCRSKG